MSRVAVIGAGSVGNGSANVFAQHGWETTLIDVSRDALDKAMRTIERNLERQAEKGAREGGEAGGLGVQTLGRIRTSTSLDGAANAELTVEAATERSEVKFELFRQLDRAAPAGAILATNTSSIGITGIAAQTKRPAQALGMHFMNPVPLFPLVHLIRGLETSDQTGAKTVEVAKALGKTPVLVNDSPGFVSNRVLMPMINEAIFCVLEGVASPEAVDTVMKFGMNHPQGHLSLSALFFLHIRPSTLAKLPISFIYPN